MDQGGRQSVRKQNEKLTADDIKNLLKDAFVAYDRSIKSHTYLTGDKISVVDFALFNEIDSIR